MTASVTLVVWALVRGPELGWTSVPVLASAGLGLISAWAFARTERRAPDPLVPGVLLANRFVLLGTVLAFLFMATFGALLYFISIYLQRVSGYDALQTGLAFLAPTGVVVVASALAGPVATRIGLRATCLIALAVGTVGAVALGLTMTADARYTDLLPGLLTVSIGDGLTFTAMFIVASTGVTPRHQGVASALVSTGSGVGAAVGLALLVLLVDPGPDFTGEALRIATAHGIQLAVLAIACGIAATLVLVFALYPRGGRNAGPAGEASGAAPGACGPSAGLLCTDGNER